MTTRVIGFVVMVSLVAALPAASGISQSRNAGITWTQNSGHFGVWGASVDGREQRRISTFGGATADSFSTPRWSPSGRVLAYNTCASDSCWIHLVRPAGSKQTLPSVGSMIEFDPAWSPDGRELAFATGVGGAPVRGRGISAVSLVAPAKRRAVTPPKFGRWDDSPDWSPDGETIAFARHTQHGSAVFLVGQNGRGLRRLTAGESPSWSPNGRFLVFSSDNGIHKIGVDGRARTPLVRLRAGEDGSPRWSPDGRKILYTTWRDGPAVWVMNTNGTNRHRVVAIHAPTNPVDASWKPG